MVLLRTSHILCSHILLVLSTNVVSMFILFSSVLVDDAPRTSAEQPFSQSKVVRPWKAKQSSMSQTILQIWGEVMMRERRANASD